MKAFVVSLVRSARRERIAARLAESRFEVVLVNAIDARDYADVSDLLSPQAQARMRQRYGREISKNEVCAVLSHLAAIRRVAAEPGIAPSLVLEDDAALQREAPPSVVFASAATDILIAGYTKIAPAALPVVDLKNPYVRTQRLGGWSIVERFHNQMPGALAYAMTPRTAAAMLALVDENGHPDWLADDWGHYQRAGFSIKHLHPTLFLEDDSGVSYLESGRRTTGFTNAPDNVNLIPLRRILQAFRTVRIYWRLLRAGASD